VEDDRSNTKVVKSNNESYVPSAEVEIVQSCIKEIDSRNDQGILIIDNYLLDEEWL
jgi:hypothetical protein